MLAELVHSPAAGALGWALVHFLWQGALIAALVAIALFLCRPASARVRYGLSCAGLVAMLAAFCITLTILWPDRAAAPVFPAFRTALPLPPGSVPVPAPSAPTDSLPWIVPFWMAGVLIFYARTAGGWLAAQRMRRRGTMPATVEWRERLRGLAARLGLSRPVLLLESCLAETPVVMGLLRPAILVPAGLLTGLPANHLEAILLHELAHIRRHDYAINVLQSLLEGLLFYHPAVWWVSGLVRAERENCCDDAVVALRGDARGYAAALAALEQRRSVGEPALAAVGGNLMKRIRRLVEPEGPRPVAGPALAAVLLLAPIAVGLSAWQPVGQGYRPAQSTPSPAIVAHAPQSPRTEARKPQERQLLARAQTQPGGQQSSAAPSPYRKWLNEDVAYIIDDRERAAFQQLTTDAEREHFIEQFWLRRDPTPGTVENEFKEEHYRRIAYANQHFASSIPGWKTDRGRIYIQYGPPDEIEDHRAGDSGANTYPYQQWRYRLIQGIGTNVIIEFLDRNGNGEYHMTMDPHEKDIVDGSALAVSIEQRPTLRPDTWSVIVTVPVENNVGPVNIFGRITKDGRRVLEFENTVTSAPQGAHASVVSLEPGSYNLAVVVKNLATNQVRQASRNFEVGPAQSPPVLQKHVE